MRRWHGMILTIGAALLPLAAPGSVAAQEPRLADRLDPVTARELSALLDSARASGLPTEPLVQKALEGALKGAPPAAIVTAVRRLRDRVQQAVAVLPGAKHAELVAAAAVLDLGAAPESLRALAARSGGRPLTGGFVGLAFLLQRGVPATTSVDLVGAMVEAQLSDADFVALQRLVDADMRAGASAAAAAQTRARALIRYGARLGGGER